MANPTSQNNNGKYVNDDIAFSILSKLPVKSINRFSSVRKSWSDFLQNPNFMKMFRNNVVSKSHHNNNDDVKLLFNFMNEETEKTELYLRSGENFQHEQELNMGLRYPFVNKHLVILGSAINGVICLYDYNNNKNVMLWNPSNGNKQILPTNYAAEEGDLDDAIVNILVHGFGYDHVNDDFNVIQHINYDGYDDPDMVSYWQIYSLKINRWRKVRLDYRIPFLQDSANGLTVYLDGVCHWLGRIKTDDPLFLVSFDLTNNLLSTTPVDVDVTESYLKLVVLNGSVAMITQYHNPMSFSISILGEIGVKDSWTRLFNVDQPLPYIKDSITAGKKGVIFFKGNEMDGIVACFDLTTELVEFIHFEAERDIQQIILYKESDRILSKKRKNIDRSVGESSKR